MVLLVCREEYPNYGQNIEERNSKNKDISQMKAVGTMVPNLTFCDIWDEWKVEEGKGRLKKGGRGRKEERLKKKEGGEGIQAPNRAEIILDHKGWNSRKSKDILRIANRLWRRERGEMNKTLEPRVRSKFLSLMMAARVVRSNLFSLMMAASTSQLDLSRKKSQ